MPRLTARARVLAGLYAALAAAGDRKEDLRLPAAGMALAGINAVPRQESAVMPTYVAAQFLLAAGFLSPQATEQDPARPDLGK
jgi:hypothetical protein